MNNVEPQTQQEDEKGVSQVRIINWDSRETMPMVKARITSNQREFAAPGPPQSRCPPVTLSHIHNSHIHNSYIIHIVIENIKK